MTKHSGISRPKDDLSQTGTFRSCDGGEPRQHRNPRGKAVERAHVLRQSLSALDLILGIERAEQPAASLLLDLFVAQGAGKLSIVHERQGYYLKGAPISLNAMAQLSKSGLVVKLELPNGNDESAVVLRPAAMATVTQSLGARDESDFVESLHFGDDTV